MLLPDAATWRISARTRVPANSARGSRYSRQHPRHSPVERGIADFRPFCQRDRPTVGVRLVSTTADDGVTDLPPHFVGGTLLIWPPDATVNAVTLGRQVVCALDALAAGALRAEIVLRSGTTLTGDTLGE